VIGSDISHFQIEARRRAFTNWKLKPPEELFDD